MRVRGTGRDVLRHSAKSEKQNYRFREQLGNISAERASCETAHAVTREKAQNSNETRGGVFICFRDKNEAERAAGRSEPQKKGKRFKKYESMRKNHCRNA